MSYPTQPIRKPRVAPRQRLQRLAIHGGLTIGCSLMLGACGLLRSEAPATTARSASGAPALSLVASDKSATTAATAAAPAAAPKKAPPPPTTFAEAVDQAGEKVFRDAIALLGNEPRQIVVDPLIDANTGAQTASTVLMGDQLMRIAKTKFQTLEVAPFTRDSIAAKPLLVVGTVTPINAAGTKGAPPDVFRVWLTVIDLRTGRVVSKNINRATMETVDARPLKFYADAPTWTRDRTVSGYINSCQVNTKVGDLADPIYLEHLPAAAVLHEAITEYGNGNLAKSRELYREAQALADPGDLRVSNGLYLTNWKLGEPTAAKDAFDNIVTYGLETGRLPLKLLFRTGSTRFSQIGDWPEQYQVWLGSLAQQSAKYESCMQVVGHSSSTGDPAANLALSQKRAETVQNLLHKKNRELQPPRLSATGVGSQELLVGIGTDDLRDALDRRVEFKVVDCNVATAMSSPRN